MIIGQPAEKGGDLTDIGAVQAVHLGGVLGGLGGQFLHLGAHRSPVGDRRSDIRQDRRETGFDSRQIGRAGRRRNLDMHETFGARLAVVRRRHRHRAVGTT